MIHITAKKVMYETAVQSLSKIERGLLCGRHHDSKAGEFRHERRKRSGRTASFQKRSLQTARIESANRSRLSDCRRPGNSQKDVAVCYGRSGQAQEWSDQGSLGARDERQSV